MSDLSSMCLTCLSNVEDGTVLSVAMYHFLCEELRFKCELKDNSTKLVCCMCYRALLAVRRFYTQLRDVELYFESKTKIPNSVVEKVEKFETCMVEVDAGEQTKIDPILGKVYHPVGKNEYCHVPPIKQRKTVEKRFACLMCSKFFSSIHELRSHEDSHAATTNRDIVPVFLPAKSQIQKRIGCSDCDERFELMRALTAHHKSHTLNKSKTFRCLRCNRKFATNDALRDHKLIHIEVQMCQCDICRKRYLNQSSLEAHMRVAHNT